MTVHQSYSAVFKKDAAAVLFYVEQMQYEIGSRDGELVRRKIGKEEVESYRYEDLIDDVDIWIFGKILELNGLRDDCRNDIERAVHESEYQKLKEDERRVGKLYENRYGVHKVAYKYITQGPLFFCAILGAAAKWQAMPLWPQVAQRRLVGARPKPVSSGQHGPKCQRRFAPYFHNLNAPFPAFFPARCSPSECQCSP